MEIAFQSVLCLQEEDVLRALATQGVTLGELAPQSSRSERPISRSEKLQEPCNVGDQRARAVQLHGNLCESRSLHGCWTSFRPPEEANSILRSHGSSDVRVKT